MPVGTNSWTEPVTVSALSATRGYEPPFTAITAYNSNRLYIATSNRLDLVVYRSKDGGDSWRKSTVFRGDFDSFHPSSHVAVGVNAHHEVYVANGFYNQQTDEDFTIIFKGKRGRNWDEGTAIENFTSPSITFDANNRAVVGTYGAGPLWNGIYSTSEQ